MISVAVGIIIKDGRVLLCQRKRTAHYGLMWEFPGGKLEPGEQPDECLRRELGEELNIDAVVGRLFHRQSFVYPDSGTFDVYYYCITSFVGEPENMVFESLAWVAIDELRQYDILEGNRDAVQKLIEEHEGNSK